jgi:hypothetical protein
METHFGINQLEVSGVRQKIEEIIKKICMPKGCIIYNDVLQSKILSKVDTEVSIHTKLTIKLFCLDS